jgi:hypothetical protein
VLLLTKLQSSYQVSQRLGNKTEMRGTLWMHSQ